MANVFRKYRKNKIGLVKIRETIALYIHKKNT